MKNYQIEIHYKKIIKASLFTVLSLYVKHEAKISFWDDENFGDTINIICSLNRAIEHLLKLKLIKTDIKKLYKAPTDFKEYCILNNLNYPQALKVFHLEKTGRDIERNRREFEIAFFSQTIDFSESKKRVEGIIHRDTFNFKNFEDIHHLRNYLEHNWSGKEEEFLKRIFNVMVYEAVPTIKEYITKVLQEDYKSYFDAKLLNKMEELNEALRNSHSMALHKRFLEIKGLYEKDSELPCEKYCYPEAYRSLYEIEISVKCPICNSSFYALFDLEADWDIADGEGYIAGVYPEVKCLHCKNCCFYVDGVDIKTYFPDSSEIDLGEYFKEDYEEY